MLTTGFLAGLGGAYLANVGAGLFVPFMTSGAGFIGIVLAMLARGRPVWVLLGALLFGVCLSLTTALQVAGINMPTDVMQMLPLPGGDGDAGDLRPAQRAAAGARLALCARRRADEYQRRGGRPRKEGG